MDEKELKVNRIEIAKLFDLYGELLTKKQQDCIVEYYNLDYSLSEIAENFSISRQGVYASLQLAIKSLNDYENKLGFLKKFNSIDKIICDIKTKENSSDLIINLDKIHDITRS